MGTREAGTSSLVAAAPATFHRSGQVVTTLALSPRNTEALKWGASVAQVAGYATMAMGMVPVNLALFAVGLIGWMLVGLIWQDRALVFVQATALAALLLGMLFG